MAHVGVKRLAAGHREESAADHGQGERTGVPEIGDGRQGTEPGENGGIPDDSDNAEGAGDDEPDQHHGAEQAADEGRAAALDQKQDDEDGHRQRDHDASQLGSINLHPLDRAQHRNRRGDGAVAVEQRRPDQADHDHDGAPAVLSGAARADQREQRQNAALAVIVGAHDQDRVFDRDDDDQRPEDQRHDAEHRLRRDVSGRTGGLRGDVERIERARSDIAEHDPHAGERRRRPGAVYCLPTHRVDLRDGCHASGTRLRDGP